MKSPFTGGEATLLFEKRKMKFRNDTFVVNWFYYKCNDTGQVFDTPGLMRINNAQLQNQYREKYSIPFPDEIRKIREQYKASAVKMSEILGLGVNSYRQYESGVMPTAANGRLIVTARNPEEFRKYLELSKNKLTAREYTKFMARVNELIGKPANHRSNEGLQDAGIFIHSEATEYTGYRKPSLEKIGMIIAYFSEHISHLWKTKLNKLLFYSDFLCYKRTGFSISGIAYRAIPFGPVPAEYEKLYIRLADDQLVRTELILYENGNYGEAITAVRPFDQTGFSPEELSALEDVAKKFERFSTKQIVDHSHEEKAWRENSAAHELISYQKYAFELQGFD